LITELAYKYAKLAENDPKAEHIKNELSRLSLLRYQLQQEATAMSNKRSA
jgi:hypothetical protein